MLSLSLSIIALMLLKALLPHSEMQYPHYLQNAQQQFPNEISTWLGNH